MARAAGIRHGLDVLGAPDVAGVQADLVDAALGAQQGQAVVKMDVGYQGHIHLFFDFVDRQGGALVRNGEAHDVRTGGTHGADLGYGRIDVMGLGIAHRLNGNRRVAADLDGADLDASGFVSGHEIPRIHVVIMHLNNALGVY